MSEYRRRRESMEILERESTVRRLDEAHELRRGRGLSWERREIQWGVEDVTES